MKKRETKHHMENLMALALFGVFAVSVLMVLLLGANVYHRLTQRNQQSYDLRTCVQYITTRVRQTDRLGGVRVEQFGGGDCLVFQEEVDGAEYITRVYCHEGELMELLTEKDAQLPPESGEAVMEAESMELALEDGLLTVAVRENDREVIFDLSLHSGEVQP